MSELDQLEEQRRLAQCYGITSRPDGGIHAVRLAVQKAMNCKISGRFGCSPVKFGFPNLTGSSKRIAAWKWNQLNGKMEICSLNPPKPRPTFSRIKRWAFFCGSKAGTTGSRLNVSTLRSNVTSQRYEVT